MAQGKKSFLLYCDLLAVVKKLPKETQAELFVHILEYVNDLDPVIENNILLEIAFEPIKQYLKRDLVKYEKIVERNMVNGSKGGRPSNLKEPKKPSGLNENPNKPDSDSDSDSDSGSVNDSGSENGKKKKKVSNKILFKDSEFFNKNTFRAEFTEWSREKLAYYYEAALTWSNEGNKKIDWAATVRGWALRDEKQGKIKFNENGKHTITKAGTGTKPHPLDAVGEAASAVLDAYEKSQHGTGSH